MTAAASEQSIGSKVALTLNPVFRKGILVATNNSVIRKSVRKHGMKLGASRFVAGETLDECIAVLRGLNAKGLRVNTTILGEGVKDEATASAVTDSYAEVLSRLVSEEINGNVALKLTHLGLDLGEEIAYANIERLVKHAADLGTFLRIDMEESARVDVTLRLYKRLREAGYANVGTVLQAYLYRTQQDLTDLLPYNPNLRLVKGAYLEPDSVAYPKKSDVDDNYLRLADRMIDAGGFTAIATHDERIIMHVKERTARTNIARDLYEFQLLYGIRTQLQLDLVAEGYRVLIATPYGPDWYYYLMRRLAERPANVLFFAKNMVRR
ncbi:proline dehydrogenase [soil metagenome]